MLSVNCQVVRSYVAVDGRCPFSEWLLGFKDLRTQAHIDARLVRLRKGNFGDCRPVGEGVFELKINFGPGYRVYYGRDGFELVVLLCGGSKRTQDSDIRRGKEYWHEYKERKKSR